MKILVATSVNTRGDFEPSLAFAKALKERLGHQVWFLTTRTYFPLVQQHGITPVHHDGDPHEIMGSKETQEALAAGDMMKVFELLKPVGERIWEHGKRACVEAVEQVRPDLIVVIPMSNEHMFSVAEKFHIPLLSLMLVPNIRTGQFVHTIAFTGATCGSSSEANLASWDNVSKMGWQVRKENYNAWRKELGLEPIEYEFGIHRLISNLKVPTICPFVAEALPDSCMPADWDSQHVFMTGYLSLCDQTKDKLDPDLDRWLNEGDPPIFLSFGSMPAPNPVLLMELAVHVQRRLNQRVIVSAGWSNDEAVRAVPHDQKVIYLIKEAPYRILFPRVKCAMHHCGAGTTGAVLMAGKPHVPVPFFLDQPFWGWNMWEKGLASTPIDFKDLTVDKLVAAIEEACSPDKIAAAAKLGEKLRNYYGDGITKALEAFNTIIEKNLLVIPHHQQ